QAADLGGMVAQASSDASHRPAQLLHGFGSHQPMSHLGQDVGGGEPLNVSGLDPTQKLIATGAENWVRAEVEDKDIGVDKHDLPGRDIRKRHDDSSRPNSGSSARRSNSSRVPVQGTRTCLM